jgi:hypothetical protein
VELITLINYYCELYVRCATGITGSYRDVSTWVCGDGEPANVQFASHVKILPSDP